jgi:hypothetical protein
VFVHSFIRCTKCVCIYFTQLFPPRWLVSSLSSSSSSSPAQAHARHHYGRAAWRNTSVAGNPVSASSSSSSSLSSLSARGAGNARSSSGSSSSSSGGGSGSGSQLHIRPPRIAVVDIDIHHGMHAATFFRWDICCS